MNKELVKAINDQITFEYYSAHVYLAMSAYCHRTGLDGFANFFKVQAREEEFHALKFFNFLVDMGEDVVIDGFKKPRNDYKDIIEVFEVALEHEKTVTRKIYNLMDLSIDMREYAPKSFLQWYVDEQVEEEANFTKYLAKLHRSKEDVSVLYKMDDEMARLTYTDPVMK